MADLIPMLYDVLGKAPPPGQELLVAANVGLIRQMGDGGMLAAGAAGGLVGAAIYSQTKAGQAGKQRQAAAGVIDKAHRELGMSNAMVWAINRGYLLVFSAGSVAGKPKKFVTRHALQHLDIVEWGKGAAMAGGVGKKRLTIKLFELPIDVWVDGAAIEPLVATIQWAQQQLPRS